MPNANDPFEMDDGFENIPVVQAPAQAVNKVTNSTVKHTAAQAKAIAKSFVSQLYGSSTKSTTDDDQQQADVTVDPAAQAQKMQAKTQGAAHAGAQHTASATSTTKTATTPEEEERLEKARRELAQTHRSDYYIPTLGEIGNLEADIRKESQKRDQQSQQRDQEKEQEKQQLVDLEERKKKEPIAVQQARTKSERRPGAG